MTQENFYKLIGNIYAERKEAADYEEGVMI
jgi:hypothetical protein